MEKEIGFDMSNIESPAKQVQVSPFTGKILNQPSDPCLHYLRQNKEN